MAQISASRITALKAKVKAECQRRNRTGSVATYGGASYDFSVAATVGGKALQEHHDKNSVPLSKINSSKVPANTTTGQKMTEKEIANMEAYVTSWAKRSITDYSATDCASSCTGLCYGCSTTCRGSCSGSCSGCTDCSGCSGCGSCGGCGGCNGECMSDCETICS